MPDIDKTITTLQYMINNARNNHLKTTTIFISTLSCCMMYLKKLKRIEQPGVLLFDDPGPIIVQCKDCKKRYTVHCIQEEAGNINNQDDWFCADGEHK